MINAIKNIAVTGQHGVMHGILEADSEVPVARKAHPWQKLQLDILLAANLCSYVVFQTEQEPRQDRPHDGNESRDLISDRVSLELPLDVHGSEDYARLYVSSFDTCRDDEHTGRAGSSNGPSSAAISACPSPSPRSWPASVDVRSRSTSPCSSSPSSRPADRRL